MCCKEPKWWEKLWDRITWAFFVAMILWVVDSSFGWGWMPGL